MAAPLELIVGVLGGGTAVQMFRWLRGRTVLEAVALKALSGQLDAQSGQLDAQAKRMDALDLELRNLREEAKTAAGEAHAMLATMKAAAPICQCGVITAFLSTRPTKTSQ